MNKFIKTVTEDRVCYEFMHSLNGIIGLTERELQVFSVLLSMRLQDIKTKNPRLSIDRAENRKRIINEYRIGKAIGVDTDVGQLSVKDLRAGEIANRLAGNANSKEITDR